MNTETLDIVERLRGKARVPITDGLGHVAGQTRYFETVFHATKLALEAAAEIERLRAARPWPDWQTIETALKDGTPVLLAGGYDECWGDCSTDIDAKLCTPTRAWWDGEDWIITIGEGGFTRITRIGPTHWMPIPPMPEVKK